jgi:hypothetical protein
MLSTPKLSRLRTSLRPHSIDDPVERSRPPELNLLAAFSMRIAGALAIGLPLALAIIFVVR